MKMKMKKIYVWLVLVSGVAFGQLDLSGDAYYKLNITGYQGRDPNACGDIDGLIHIKATYQDGSSFFIFNGRKLHENVDHEEIYTKDNPITNLEFHKIVRWKTAAGCDGGPNRNYDEINIDNTCFSSYQKNAGSELHELTVTSKPYIQINQPITPLYLGDAEALKITLPNNLEASHYNWKYSVGGGPIKEIPSALNHTSILNIKAENFLTDADFGKTVYVWVNMNCSAGSEQAKGYAHRKAYDCRNNCPGGLIAHIICQKRCEDNYDTLYNQNYTPQLEAEYQSLNSNVISFTYLKSAPKIISTPVPTNVSCYDLEKKDGTLQLTFDRKLFPNETLKVTLYGKDSNGNTTSEKNYPITIPDDKTYTLTGLARGEYTLDLFGGINGIPTFSPTTDNPISFTIGSHPPVDFKLYKTDVRCFGGQDGTITIEGIGGIREGYQYSLNSGTSWFPFSHIEGGTNNESFHTITGLGTGTKTFKVKDGNGCIAKMPNDNEKELSETITQPAVPVVIDTIFAIKEPTFFGATNGQIVARVSGGTPNADKSYVDAYTYEWVNGTDVSQNLKTSSQYNASDKTFSITLNGVPAGIYYLTVKDKNYVPNKNNYNCTVVRSEYELKEPDKLIVTFEVKHTISCNATNTFGNEADKNYDGQRDESQDGILIAHVTGGVAYTGFANGGLPYQYFWKKQKADKTWEDLSKNKDSIATYISHGEYALNIKDANGIMLGTYDTNNELDQEQDVIQSMPQPDRLELTFTKGDITCGAGNDGWAQANVQGGTSPYTYEWTTDEKTAMISGLIRNNYFVKITDSLGCSHRGNIMVEQPDGVVAHETIFNPTCFHGSDGAIVLLPAGGITPYHYAWSTGATSSSITNLSAGNYAVTITDAQACSLIQNFTLTDPQPIVVDLGGDRTLCNAQNLELDTTIPDTAAQYSWTSTNGFTADTAKVSLTEAGIYQARVTSGLGCVGEAAIEIKTNNVAIDSEFFLSSQAYLDEEVILVNVSTPMGENTQWVIPEEVAIVEQKEKYIVLKFPAIGMYPIGLKQTQGDCYAEYSKNINVEARNVLLHPVAINTFFVRDFIVMPNPSDGNFKVVVNLESNSPIQVRLFSAKGEYTSGQKIESSQKNYVVDFTTKLPSGIYVLVLETPQQTLVKKIIVY